MYSFLISLRLYQTRRIAFEDAPFIDTLVPKSNQGILFLFYVFSLLIIFILIRFAVKLSTCDTCRQYDSKLIHSVVHTHTPAPTITPKPKPNAGDARYEFVQSYAYASYMVPSSHRLSNRRCGRTTRIMIWPQEPLSIPIQIGRPRPLCL
ncbi:hypothetical protein GYMLUDRAFT_556278 [Collybiopsis luxurians FD-317 M1]|uniref:Uncharacterized protein n=1 Tax=Collybiopsis luxurians FD-317 M1 TaxID=944289 RepID=A0A0D0CSL2_9AGAR|nr:hypothetical protein GYMLUDRAFT_556278 [Collybiopsis luxurians FD-317 M1]